MTKFHPKESFETERSTGYRLLPFRYTALDESRYVLTNLVGEYLVTDRETIERTVKHALDPTHPLYPDLVAKHFVEDAESSIAQEMLALKLRSKLAHLSEFTSLHIFVVTLRCEHSCPYCQVSRQTDDKVTFDMSPEIAEKALTLAFRSPARALKFEFQGGEPLLNFPLIQFIVERAEALNQEERRNLQFVIATNLAVLTEDMLEFCKTHSIHISTSLDGPRELHNANRPRPGRDSYEKAVQGIARVRAALGADQVSALMTTTQRSLISVDEIIDEYLALDFPGIFLRPLSPYGFAIKTRTFAAYKRAEWIDFYRRGLNRIIEINKSGKRFVEQYSAIILTKMLAPWNPGYVDLMSPAGAGIAAIVYNYDGAVYASDEARMLAEMGDQTFRIGTVDTPYEEIILSPVLLDALDESFADSAPMCTDCAFEPYCGADPVHHQATQRSFVGKKPLSDFCGRHMEMCRILIDTMERDPAAKEIFYDWAFH